MIQIILLELFKIFSKWRTYIGFLAIGFIVPVVQLAMYAEGSKYIELVTQNLNSVFQMQGNLLNGYMVTNIILQSLYIHVPLLVTLVTGDLLAGEATSGTYRLLLTRPISRLKIVAGKYIAGQIFTFSLILWLAILSLGVGILIFGTGDMIVVRSTITLIKENDVMWRFICSFLFAYLSMAVVSSFAFLFSAFVENSIGPIMTTMALIIIFSIINILDLSFFVYLQPLLFTNYLPSWRLFFDNPIDWNEIYKSLYVLIAHIIVIITVTFTYFVKKDVQS